MQVVTTARGTFITFEGLDGCGKSTQLERLAAKLHDRGLAVITTREPGGTQAGERIRQLLLDVQTSGLDPMAELALMFAARAQHLEEVILPALDAGKVVLCDRFTDSSEAYQGAGRRLGSAPVLALDQVICRGMKPDLTILMDSAVGVCVDRARRRNQATRGDGSGDESRFEGENRAFFTRVHSRYLEIAKREPVRVAVVNARGTPEETHKQIVKIVFSRLSAKRLPGNAQNVS
jgi:dTMP kinase